MRNILFQFSKLLFVGACSLLSLADEAELNPVSFRREIASILAAKCLACHDAEKAKGGYRVDTYHRVLTAGKSGDPAILPREPQKSEVVRRLTTLDPDDRMPQKDEPLSSAQIDLFKRWIADGATLDDGDADAPLSSLLPKLAHSGPPKEYSRPLPVLTLGFLPGGSGLVVNGYREVTVWNIEGELQQRITNVPPRVRALAAHPEGSWLVLAGGKPGREGEVSVYNLGAGQFETNLLRTADEMLAVAFSPDGKLLAAGGSDNAIHIYSWEKREKVATIQQHADWVTALSFSVDGAHLASASRDRTARVYDPLSGALVTTYVSQAAPLLAVVFASTNLVASGGRDREIHFWNANDGKKAGEIGGLEGDVNQLLEREGKVFAACADGMVRMYNAADRKLVRKFSGHADGVFAIALDAKGERLASGSYDGEVRFWNVAEGTLERAFYPAPNYRPAATH